MTIDIKAIGMMTHSGAMVGEDFGLPTLDDIALALSRVPRFGGHCRTDWTVIQHSLVCAMMTSGPEAGPLDSLACLLHDAHEAVTGDVPAPVKPDALKQLQLDIDWRLAEAYFPGGGYSWAHHAGFVHRIDYRALLAEAVTVGPPKISLGNVKMLFGEVPTPHDMLAVKLIQTIDTRDLVAIFLDRFEVYREQATAEFACRS